MDHQDDELVPFLKPSTDPDSHVSKSDLELMAELDMVPLLGGQRPTTSHRTVMSLFDAEEDYSMKSSSPSESVPIIPFSSRASRYFRPMMQRKYYATLLHLLLINFLYALAAWVYIFVGTLTGTILLITLPIGATICFLNVVGARALARGEIALQTFFHGPLCVSPPNPPRPIFSRMRPPAPNEAGPEEGHHSPVPVPETSFLRLSYLMFRDPTTYQALFYFLVVKPGLALLITIELLILIPPAFILVVPAPMVLRAVRRVGIWQAEIAIDALT